MSTPKEKAQAALEELKQLRDQIKLKLHLGGMEAKAKWEELEPKLEHLDNEVERAGQTLGEATDALMTDVGKAIREFGQRLMNRSSDDS